MDIMRQKFKDVLPGVLKGQKLPAEPVKQPNPMKLNDLKCVCSFTADHADFKRRGNLTICPKCNSDAITDFYGLQHNTADAIANRYGTKRRR